MKKSLLIRNILIGVVVSSIFLWLAIRDIDLSLAWREMAGIRWGYVLLVLVMYAFGVVAMALRWHRLLDRRATFPRVMHVINLANLINTTIPLRAGELVRIYLITQPPAQQLSGWTVLSTFATERFMDMLTVVFVLAIVPIFLDVPASVISMGLILGGLGLAGFVTLVVFSRKPEWAHQIVDLMGRVIPFLKKIPLHRFAERLLIGVKPLGSWRGVSSTVLFTGLTWASWLMAVWTLGLAFPEFQPSAQLYAALALAVVATTFSTLIPFTIASVGPFETAVIFALGTIGIPQETALVYGIILHLVLIVHVILWGMIGMFSTDISIASMKTAVQESYARARTVGAQD